MNESNSPLDTITIDDRCSSASMIIQTSFFTRRQGL